MQAESEPAPGPGKVGGPSGGPRSATSSQTKLFFDVYRWLWRDAILRYPFATLVVVVLDLASVGLGAGLVAVILRSVSTLAAGESLHLPIPGEAAVSSSALGVGLLAIAAIGATLAWGTDWWVRRTAARYQHDSTLRAVQILRHHGPAPWALQGTTPPQQTARQAIRAAPMILDRCHTWLLMSIRQALIGVVAAVALVVIDPGLTAWLLPLLPIYLWSLLRIGGRARGSGAISRDARGRLSGALDALEEEDSEARFDDVRAASQEVADSWAERRLMASRSSFVNGLLLAATLAVVFLSVSPSAEGEVWTRLAAYVVALRFLVGGLRANANTIVRLQLQPEPLDAFRTVVGGRSTPPRVAALASDPAITSWVEQAQARAVGGAATLVLVVPWLPSRFDLGLAQALVGPHLPSGTSLENLEAGAVEKAGSWGACRVRKWEALAEQHDLLDPTSSPHLLLVARDSLAPDRLLRRALGREIDGVLVWNGGGAVEVGDWPWYRDERFIPPADPDEEPEARDIGVFEAAVDLDESD